MRRYLDKINFIGFAFLLLYVIFISWRLFFYAYSDNYREQMTSISYNIIPFKTIMNYIVKSSKIGFDVWIYNLAGNVAAFMPLGYLLPSAFKSFKADKTYMTAFFLVLLAEIMQLITRRGVFDVDDLLLNMLGCIVGYGLHKLTLVFYNGRS